MNFAELPPSQRWASLTFRGESFAEVWFKPEVAPYGLTFRIPQKSFQSPEISQNMTIENLLKTIGIATDEAESWRCESDSPDGLSDYQPELNTPLPPPPRDVSLLSIHIDMKPATREIVQDESDHPGDSQVNRQSYQTRWNTILAMEVTLDTLRQRMESLRAEIEAATGKSLSAEEKLNALNNDVALWNKAKSRARYVLPRIKEFLHRATWAMGTPERKKLEIHFKDHDEPPPQAQLDRELQILLKDRQILSAQGVAGYQEGKNSSDDMQRALRTLQSNASANAAKKRAATRAKNK